MQIGHPLLLFPLPLVLIYRAGQRLAKRKARKKKLVKSGLQPRWMPRHQMRGRSSSRCAYRRSR